MLCKHPCTKEAICSGLALQLPGPHLDLVLPGSQRTSEQRTLQALHHLHIGLEVSHLRLACRHGRHGGRAPTLATQRLGAEMSLRVFRSPACLLRLHQGTSHRLGPDQQLTWAMMLRW